MNITKVEKEQGAALLRIVVEEADYAAEVEKMLREYKRKANIPGFRQGMVPMGVIKKMYGKGAVAEQAYRKASNAAFEYLQSEKIGLIPSNSSSLTPRIEARCDGVLYNSLTLTSVL